MNLKKQKIIQRLMNLSLIFYIAYLVSALYICFVPKSASIILGTVMPDGFVRDRAQIIGIIAAALLFFLSYLLCRNKVKTNSKSTLFVGIVTILFEAIIVFVLPIVVNYFRVLFISPLLSSGTISQEVYAGWIAADKVVDLLCILMYPALLLLLVAYSVYWIDTKTDIANADR